MAPRKTGVETAKKIASLASQALKDTVEDDSRPSSEDRGRGSG